MKMNTKANVETSAKSHSAVTTNYEGGLAFKLSPETELFQRAATCLMNEPRFYEEAGKTEAEMRRLIKDIVPYAPEYPLQLAAYCRNSLYLRSVPIFLLVEACAFSESRQFVRSYAPHIIKRADEITETMAYYIAKNGDIGNHSQTGMMCNQLKKALADAFGQFNEYQLAKYDRDGLVKLKDVMRICHPKPVDDEQAALFRRVLDRTLMTPDTWETKISADGSTKESWTAIMSKMGFMARLRNLRNFLNNDVGMAPIIEMLTDHGAVRRSKQLPFRFYSAYRELQGNPAPQTGQVIDALQEAIELSVGNFDQLPGMSFITCDNSVSMTWDHISRNSSITPKDIAALMGALSHHMSEQSIVSAFASNHRVVTLSKRDGVLTNAAKVYNTRVGGATNAYKALKHLNDNQIMVDRIILLSDMECYGPGSLATELQRYKSSINPNVRLYTVNLNGYGTAQFPESDMSVIHLAGWSDRIIGFITAMERANTITAEIMAFSP